MLSKIKKKIFLDKDLSSRASEFGTFCRFIKYQIKIKNFLEFISYFNELIRNKYY